MARIVLDEGLDYILPDGESPELTNPVGVKRLLREAAAGNEVVIEVDEYVIFRCPTAKIA